MYQKHKKQHDDMLNCCATKKCKWNSKVIFVFMIVER